MKIKALPVLAGAILFVATSALATGPKTPTVPVKAPSPPSVVVHGVKYFDQVTVDGKALSLNGVGIRHYNLLMFVSVPVYTLGLYLLSPERNANKIIGSQDVRYMRMVFLRSVSGRKIANAWRKGLEDHCGSRCPQDQPVIRQFVEFHNRAVKNGSEVSYTLYPDHVKSSWLNGPSLSLSSPDLAKMMLLTWLGSKPADAGLKKKLLAGK